MATPPRHHDIPAQHGVGLRCENGRVHHEAGVVHDERDPLGQPEAAAVALFAAQVVHVDHVTQTRADSLGVVVRPRGKQRPGHVAGRRGPS